MSDDIDMRSYDIGYSDGESSGYDDWQRALQDAGVPYEIVSQGPGRTSEWLDAELQRLR
jgi:hypothetical protein